MQVGSLTCCYVQQKQGGCLRAPPRPPLHQNCRRTPHLPQPAPPLLLRNCAEIERCVALSTVSSHPALSFEKRQYLPWDWVAIFLRDSQTSFCRHWKIERVKRSPLPPSIIIFPANWLDLGKMQFSEWWQNLCWLRSEHFHREPIFAQILLPPLILLTLTYESQNADGKIFWHETDLTSVVHLNDGVFVLKTSSMHNTNDTSQSQISWKKDTKRNWPYTQLVVFPSIITVRLDYDVW